MNIIEIKNLTFKYDNENDIVFNNVFLNIQKGEFISIIGPNGCGKTTLAKTIIGLLKPTSGEIIKDDYVKFGYVFQNPDNQFVGNTVEDDIAFGLENECLSSKEMGPIIDKVLEQVDMTQYKKFEPTQLSGGQKQRIAVASCLALNPNFIIFDEATSMLDPEGKESITKLILKLKENNPELAIIQITHDIYETMNSTRIIGMKNGKVEFDGKSQDFFKNAANLEYFNLETPFKYKLVKALKNINIDVSINDSFDELRKKCYENRS